MKKVMIIKTGGTLVMKGEPLEPGNYSETLLEHVPEIAQLAEIQSEIICNLDSSDISSIQWNAMIDAITRARRLYDGVVVIHGTDTMAYTASALSFALESLDIPVVLTGSQRPLASVRSDARRNLADSVELATMDIPEVGICFDGMLLRGCCTTKAHGHDYRAFASPGVEPLARLGVDISLSSKIRHPQGPFRSYPMFDENVLLLQVFPGMKTSYIEALIEGQGGDLHGIVLGTFGLGTVPNLFHPIAPVLKQAIDAGIEVMAVTQSTGKIDLGAYKNSRVLNEIGVISGGSMGYEAAVTKMMHALARFSNSSERRDYLQWNVAGESS